MGNLQSTGEIFDIVSVDSLVVKHAPLEQSAQQILSSKPPIPAGLKTQTAENGQKLSKVTGGEYSTAKQSSNFREKRPISFRKVKEPHQIGDDQIKQLKMAIQMKEIEIASNQK